MKSKISFFNKTIYLKNITLFWPIWSVYLMYLLATGPGLISLEFNMSTRKELRDFGVEYLTYYFNVPHILGVSFIAAIIVAMALYNYLFIGKNANMIHALPVSRVELFGTNLLSGFTFLFVPQIITFITTVFVCLGYGVTAVEYLGIWLLLSMGVTFLFFSMAVFCAFLTGQLFALPLYYIGFHCLYEFLKLIVGMVVDFSGFGISYYSISELMKLDWLSPIFYLDEKVHLEVDYIENLVTGDMIYNGISFEGGEYILLYLIPAVILLVISYLFYQKRQIETAGDWVTVSFLKPVFRWGIGLIGGYFLGIGLSEILSDFNVELPIVIVFVLVLLMAIVFFFITEMFLQKNFMVFKKKRVAEMGIFAVFMLVTFLGIQGGIHMIENYVPEKEEVKFATVEINYPTMVEGDEIERVLEVHQMIVDNKKSLRESKNEYYSSGFRVEITYYLENGEFIQRNYWMSWSDESEEIYDFVTEVENMPENYLNNLFGTPYDEAVIEGGYVEIWRNEDLEEMDTIEFTKEEAQKVYEAIVEDAMTGALQKYNQQTYYEEFSKEGEELLKEIYELNISLYLEEREQPNRELINDFYEEHYDYYYEEYVSNAWVCIGKDCTNILQVLIEIGAIESEEELITQWETTVWE